MALECLAIGSLPHNNPKEALEIVANSFPNIPFWPQLATISKNEDMTIQFLEGMPSFFISEDFRFDTQNKNFYAELEQFLLDYTEIVKNQNQELLEKYAISNNFESSFEPFIKYIEANKCPYAKGQIIGPYTLATTLTDLKGERVIYNGTLWEIIVKILSLKALWQIKHISSAGAKPIIFIDEPSISKITRYPQINKEDVASGLKEISNIIKSNGGISGIHCCSECNWDYLIKTGIDMISLDAYTYGENLGKYYKEVNKFLENNGKIVWGIVPTLDNDSLIKANDSMMMEIFEKAVNYLTKNGINEKLIIENSYVSPSCGAGSLPVELAQKAMNLTKNLSDNLKERYNDN